MNLSNYIITLFILLGALIMLMSAAYTKKIFNLLPDNKLKSNWKKLRLLMFVFLAGYLAVAITVILGKMSLLDGHFIWSLKFQSANAVECNMYIYLYFNNHNIYT